MQRSTIKCESLTHSRLQRHKQTQINAAAAVTTLLLFLTFV